MKTILLHVQDDATIEARLQAAMALARACSAHLSCLHVTPIGAYTYVTPEVQETLKGREADLHSKVVKELETEDVSWDYELVTDTPADVIVRHAALADVIVSGREAYQYQSRKVSFLPHLGEVLHSSRTPLYIPGNGPFPSDLIERALIAWDGSSEAANAVRASISLLKLASNVQVLTIDETKSSPLPIPRLLEYLSRHDIHADLKVQTKNRHLIADELLDEAKNLNASYIVMGSYSRSRLGERIFGGVTHSLLTQSPLPLLIAH